MRKQSVRPHIAVIIPTYNYVTHLTRAIRSAVEQQPAPSQVIVIDDGSTDDTPRIVQCFSGRVENLRQRRSGPYLACKRGIERVPHDGYVVFLDSDDRLRPGYLRAMVDMLARHPRTELAFGQLIHVNRDGRQRLAPALSPQPDAMANFRAFVRGDIELCAGGGLFARRIFDTWLEQDESVGRIHGFDRVVVALALAYHVPRWVAAAQVQIHDRPNRLRDDVDAVCATSLHAVDALFDPGLLPPDAMALRDTFKTQLLLEQGRLLYRSANYPDAAARYRQARQVGGLSALGRRHLRRYVISTIAAALGRCVRSIRHPRSAHA
jgi:glycosyltransferase involved in cell wall biosynthesis